MLPLVFMLAAADFAGFDADRAARLCTAKRTDEIWQSVYATNEACVADQKLDHSRAAIVAAAADPTMMPSFDDCLVTWTKDGLIDWGMVRLCVVENVDGKRDVAMLRKTAPRTVRPALDQCEADAKKDGPPDWDDIASCARDQISAARDIDLARAAAKTDDDRRLIARCAAASPKDPILDWEDALRCALGGGGEAKGDDDIIIT